MYLEDDSEKKFSEASPAISRAEAVDYLEGKLPLITHFARAAIERERFFGTRVRVHILDNIQNGNCAEDCGYCLQRRSADSKIQNYPMKSDEEILAAALKAKQAGAYRFCMVSSGTGPSARTTERLAALIRRINEEIGVKICLSAGVVDDNKATLLAKAGLDRYNHNLNTSANHYGAICSTHTYRDRIDTLSALSAAGVGLCAGVIVGLGETASDLVDAAFALKELRVISIPVNFFIPIPGHAIQKAQELSAEYCLRVLTVFRLINPDSEIRIGAGREFHLRSLQAMALRVANSLFAEGYLNVQGQNQQDTLRMIHDAGLTPEVVDSMAMPEQEDSILQANLAVTLKYPKPN